MCEYIQYNITGVEIKLSPYLNPLLVTRKMVVKIKFKIKGHLLDARAVRWYVTRRLLIGMG